MQPQAERFLSLDVFRGMTLCFMIIVNTPGSGAIPYDLLEHAPWHGFTPTDLVFPSCAGVLNAVRKALSTIFLVIHTGMWITRTRLSLEISASYHS